MSTPIDRRAFLKRASEVVGIGLVVPLLAACGSAATPAASSAVAKPSEAAKPAASAASASAVAAGSAAAKGVTKVSYAYASANGYHLVSLIGAEKPDFTRKYGIEFDLVTTTNSPNAVNALVGGSVNFASVTPDAAWAAQDKAPDVKQVAAIADGTPYVLIAQPEIKKAAELKGKTFGASAVRGGADTTAIMVMMLENGVKPDEYTIVQAGAVSDRVVAMKAKTIQGIAQLEPQATQLRDEGFPEIDNANNYAPLKNVQSLVIISKKSWYEKNEDVAVNFFRAWTDITKWLYDPKNKDEVLAISKKTMSVGDKPAEGAYDLHVVKGKVASQDLHVNEKAMQQFIQNLKRAGIENLPADPMKFVDMSLVDKALKA